MKTDPVRSPLKIQKANQGWMEKNCEVNAGVLSSAVASSTILVEYTLGWM